MTKIQNKSAEVENKNLTELVKNEVVESSTQKIFEAILNLENIENLAELISTNMSVELMHASFMSEQLELTEKQKEKLLSCMKVISERSKNQYLTNIKTDKRTEKIAEVLTYHLHSIVEEMLSSLAQEVNRGALINCWAVAADTKSEKYNKIELNAMKSAGDITIPTKCVLVSTNCLELIKQSIKIEEKNQAYDLETGEIKND